MSEEINLQAAILRYEDPILYLIIKEEALLEPANIKEMADKARELSHGRSFLLFSDARVNMAITPEGRFAASDKNIISQIGAGAILITSWPVKMFANFFLKFSRAPFPIKLFTDAAQAMDWLKLQKGLIY